MIAQLGFFKADNLKTWVAIEHGFANSSKSVPPKSGPPATSHRRYATVKIAAALIRGMNPPATFFSSLRDENALKLRSCARAFVIVELLIVYWQKFFF